MSTKTQVVVETEPRKRRSVFGNYKPPTDARASVLECGSPLPISDAAPATTAPEDRRPSSVAGLRRVDTPKPGGGSQGIPQSMTAASAEVALSRSFVHQWLARAFDYPSAETWPWLCSAEAKSGLSSSIAAIERDVRAPVRAQFDTLLSALKPDAFEAFHNDYITAIGHAARGSCPVNEIEYGDLKADPLFQPHRLADLAAFYRAFGVELGTLADERHDHLSVELEFMAVLAAQEASMLSGQSNPDGLSVGRDAQRKFLREHLGRWTPAFARRLARVVGNGALGSLALFALAFIESECGRFGVKSGSEDLLLRPAEEGAALCEGCGLSQLLPGTSVTQTCG